MRRRPTAIDKEKVRAAVCKLKREIIFSMLDEAIDLLPPTKLHKIARKYLDEADLQPDNRYIKKASLLKDVKAFDTASRAGEYYEPFMVNSRNCMEQSTGTTAWIAEFHGLLDRCTAEAKKGKPSDVRESFDILFGLLDRIDEGNDDVIFFADEGGSYEVGVDWEGVLPHWFRVLAATASPEEYAERITALIGRHYHFRRDKMLAVGRRIATPIQRAALAGAASPRPPARRRGTRR